MKVCVLKFRGPFRSFYFLFLHSFFYYNPLCMTSFSVPPFQFTKLIIIHMALVCG